MRLVVGDIVKLLRVKIVEYDCDYMIVKHPYYQGTTIEFMQRTVYVFMKIVIWLSTFFAFVCVCVLYMHYIIYVICIIHMHY